jgi:tetraacyldisaccharide 4'-kinase
MRADAIVELSDGSSRATATAGLPVIRAALEPIAGERFAGARLVAFAGIGRPEKFFAMLRKLGAELAETRPFPDHYRYRAADIAGLRRAADKGRAGLVTTAKDIVRLAPAARAGIDVLAVRIRWLDPMALAGLCAPIAAAANRHDKPGC